MRARHDRCQHALHEQTKAPTAVELNQLTHTLAFRIGRYLKRQGLLERDAENSYLADDDLDSGPMAQLQGASITYRVAVGPQQGRKVFTLQTLPATEQILYAAAGKVAGFSLHAGASMTWAQRLKRVLLRASCAPPFGSACGCSKSLQAIWSALIYPRALSRCCASIHLVETCPACGGAVRIVACIEEPDVIEKILAHLDEKTPGSPRAQLPPSRASPQLGLFD